MKIQTFPLPHKIKEGHNEDFKFTTKAGAHPSIQINIQTQLTKEQQADILKRLKTIVLQETCKAIDSNIPGDKYTHCNWGMCTNSPQVFHEPGMHTFPYDFINNGRVTSLTRFVRCPMDKRTDNSPHSGCFYHCRIFQGPKPDQNEALQLVQIRVKELAN